MELKPDNFDQEFSLKDKKKKKNEKDPRGKIPSWLMILAGVAVIGGIVAARQPALHTTNTAQTSITVSTSQPVSFEPAIFTGINDEKLDPSELEAHFISQGNMMNSQYIQPVFTDGTIMGIDMELAPLSVDENGDADLQITAENNADIYWIDGKPYEVKIQNEMKQSTSSQDEKASEFYFLNGQPYEVHLEPVSEAEIQALPGADAQKVVQIGTRSYLMEMTPVTSNPAPSLPEEKASVPVLETNIPESPAETVPQAKKEPSSEAEAPASDPKPETTAEISTSEDSTAVVWLDNKAYSITIKPQGEAEAVSGNGSSEDNSSQTAASAGTEASPAETDKGALSNENGSVPTPGTVQEPTAMPKKEQQLSVFTVEGKPYELQLTELSGDEIPSKQTTEPVVWLDETPLRVVLNAEASANSTDGTSENTPKNNQPIEVSLLPLPADQTRALQTARFGEDHAQSDNGSATAAPEQEPTEVPTPIPTAEPEESNWIVNVFHNIFGSSPTQEPTPQVTVVQLSPTPTVIQPTATPITILMMPTATAQGPVRLDVTETPAETGEQIQSKDGDLDDPALHEEDEEEKEQTTALQVTLTTPLPEPTKTPAVSSSAERVEAVVVETLETPAVQETPEELPHTGMAEGWNIPSLLGLLAGLMLVIIGVRRLRSKN